MKRILFTALALACFVGVANAQTTMLSTPRWSTGNVVMFRTLGSGVNADTAWATGSATRTDTTVAFPWFDVYQPSTVPLASDSLVAAIVRIDPIATSGITLSADTVYVSVQASPDGDNWVTATPTGGGAQTVYNATGANRIGYPIVETASANCWVMTIRQLYAATGYPSSAVDTTPTVSKLYGWRYIRFLVGHANTGKFQLSVDYQTLK